MVTEWSVSASSKLRCYSRAVSRTSGCLPLLRSRWKVLGRLAMDVSQRFKLGNVEHTPWNPLKPGPHSACEFHLQVFHVCLDRFEAEELYGDGEPNNSGHGNDADHTGGWTRATCGTQRLN